MRIRTTGDAERAEIAQVHAQAFGGNEGGVIANLVEELLDDPTARPALSLGAEVEGRLVGHVLFTMVDIAGADESVEARILAPLAVLPEHQGRGIGCRLVNEGLQILRDAGVALVFVLGHPGYYPRCGFVPAGVRGFDAPYPIPEKNADAWMVQGLKADVVGRIRGTVQCAEALSQPEYWRE
jgi:predicted N-acetyltransferase YhbS